MAMSAAPGNKGGSDFLKGLPDTGYRPWQQKSVRGRQESLEPESKATPTGGGGTAALMTLLQILLEAGGALLVDDLERLALERGVASLDFYRALPTLVESQLATKDPAGFTITENGKKVAAFAAS
jgi:hypothetical protein